MLIFEHTDFFITQTHLFGYTKKVEGSIKIALKINIWMHLFI